MPESRKDGRIRNKRIKRRNERKFVVLLMRTAERVDRVLGEELTVTELNKECLNGRDANLPLKIGVLNCSNLINVSPIAQSVVFLLFGGSCFAPSSRNDAEGKAEAAHMLCESMKSAPGFLKLRKISAVQRIAKTVSSASSNLVSLPSDVLMLNIADNDYLDIFNSKDAKKRC